jgi:hypothetical protein
MNRKTIVFIVGWVFFISGMIINGKTPSGAFPVGVLIGILGGVIMGLSVSLDKNEKLFK